MQATVRAQRSVILGTALVLLLLIAAMAHWMDRPGQLAHSEDNLLRLHVLANSDAPADQDLKLLVRDGLIPLLQQVTTDASDADAMEQAVQAAEEQLRIRAEEIMMGEGFGYSARVEVGPQYFEERSTGDATLPEGTYRTVLVVLGEGKGQNWWCVLFPPLCFSQLENGGVEVVAGRAADLPEKPTLKFTWRYLDRLFPKAYASPSETE